MATGYVYVVDAGNHRVQYFTSAGSFLGSWGGQGSGAGQFNNPQGAAAAKNGNVYVTDAGNHRVQYFSSLGSYVGTWGARGTGDGEFDTPNGVAVGPEGNVFVVDSYNQRVQYFTLTGSFTGKWGYYGLGDGQFNYPCGVVANSWSPADTARIRVYVADTNNNRIQFFKDVEPAVEPASLGRVKALYK